MRTTIATSIELIVLNWLNRNKIEYEFQSSLMGGFYELGGAVVDILLPQLQLAWRIFGEYWHRGISKSGSDLIQKESLSARGWTVVDIWERNIRENLEQTMRLAIQGKEML